MSYIVKDITQEKITQYRAATVKALIERALHCGLARDESGLEIRDLVSSDLGQDFWHTPPKKGWSVWIDCSPKAVIGIYQFVQLSANPTVATIRINDERKYAIEVTYGSLAIARALRDEEVREVLDRLTDTNPNIIQLEMSGYFSEPYIIDGGEKLKIEVQSRTAKSDKLVLVGFAVEATRGRRTNVSS